MVHSFTARMPLLTAASAFRLGRRCWNSPPQCYLHCLCTFICTICTYILKYFVLSLHESELARHYKRYITVWLGSREVSVLDSGAEGPGFKLQPWRCRVTVLGKNWHQLWNPMLGNQVWATFTFLHYSVSRPWLSHVLMLLVQRYAFLLGLSWRYANAKDVTAKWHSAIAQHQLCSTRRT